MSPTRELWTIIRSNEKALADVKSVFSVMKRYGRADQTRQPVDAQPFSVSSTRGHMYLHQLSTELTIDKRYPRPFINERQNVLQKMFKTIIDPKWMLHRSTYIGAQKYLSNREQLVIGSQQALQRILNAIREKNLSSLSPMLLDDGILPSIATTSQLSNLTHRQLDCLDISDQDLIGVDGVVDRWKRIDLPEEDPSGLMRTLRIGISEKMEKPILAYSIDFMAILRKNVLVSKMGSLPPPTDHRFMPAPSAYRLPYMRTLYATVEFAHKATNKIGEFSEEPFILDFHVHSF
ncbi:hypothetical protein PFISCL1PPCAC_23478 [Pristionchus fissidentatus]|uniref:Uncharacterized protein n=1 Tax=Pristionchus fissidentatus TaxID=1538716 RepID=A0AAV5WMH7_9BILA|nr:hypothetical protein PFISCL1PPCAC_23478 [Pristionchus fissidentatus]